MADEKEALKHQLEDAHPEWRHSKPMPKPISSVLGAMIERLPREDYAHDPWWIMRVQPNSYATATTSLERAGFESYLPTYKALAQTPLRKIPPKKRHQAHLYRQKVLRRHFEGYMFMRRMFGTFDVNRMFDLNGCGAIVKGAGRAALVFDYEIELMRLIEADGSMDQVQVEAYRGYRITAQSDEQRWTGTSRIIGRLDDSKKTVLFVERMGRIARLISEADPS